MHTDKILESVKRNWRRLTKNLIVPNKEKKKPKREWKHFKVGSQNWIAVIHFVAFLSRFVFLSAVRQAFRISCSVGKSKIFTDPKEKKKEVYIYIHIEDER